MLLQPAELAGRNATRLIACRAGGPGAGSKRLIIAGRIGLKILFYRNGAFAT